MTKRAFYEYHASLMEPWDGPPPSRSPTARSSAQLSTATACARPLHLTKDDLVVLASEAGVLEVPAEDILKKGACSRRMFLVDTVQQRIVSDAEIKKQLLPASPTATGSSNNRSPSTRCPSPRASLPPIRDLLRRQRACGYSEEDLRILSRHGRYRSRASRLMARCAAGLSLRSPQLCSTTQAALRPGHQSAIDPIREELVMSLISYIGTERNILDEAPENCHTLRLPYPILTNPIWKAAPCLLWRPAATTLPALFRASDGEKASATR